MFQITLIARGVPIELGPQGAIDITEEFTHRNWHQGVRCEWTGQELTLHAENDWCADAKLYAEALLDEFSDAISACVEGTFDYAVEVGSIISAQSNSPPNKIGHFLNPLPSVSSI